MDSNYGMNSTEVSDIVTCTGGMTMNCIILCHLYSLLKQWVSEESIGSNITTISPDTDRSNDNDTAFIFSTADCRAYYWIRDRGDDKCANITEVFNNYRDQSGMRQFTSCFLFFFMTEMGAIEKCPNISQGADNNTKDENTMTLLSKDRIFYSFMNDSFGLGDVCETNTTVSYETDVKEGILTTDICDSHSWLKFQNAENKCRPTDENDTGISHFECVWYRLQAELGVPSFCNSRCDMYDFVMHGIVGGVLSIVGIICSIGSLTVFRHRIIKTPTTYLLHCLALVDTIFLVLCFVWTNLSYIIKYVHFVHDNLYWRVIAPHILVYIGPVWRIAQTSTNWLTLFIGVYQYLAICKPVSNLYRHVERHRRKYVKMVLSMATLCNIPFFFVHNISQDDRNNMVYFKVDKTRFSKNDFFDLAYENIMKLAFNVCLPVITLFVVTTKIMMVLRKKQRNMQNSDMSNLNINTVLTTILRTFIICQLPLLVDTILHFTYDLARWKTPGCGSFHFYNSVLFPVFLVLNSAVRPFIYMVLQNHFTWSLRYTLRNERAESIAMSSM